jgi:hypothetical protein
LSTTQIAVIFCETSNPTKWVINQPPTVRITGRRSPDRGTIGGSGTDRDYRMSTDGKPSFSKIASMTPVRRKQDMKLILWSVREQTPETVRPTGTAMTGSAGQVSLLAPN